jgi:protein TonB
VPRPALPSSAEAAWRREVAQRIQVANASKVFEGAPPHPLKAVVVLDLIVGADGRLQRVSVIRTPSHARELGDEAMRTVRAAVPLPAPPRALLNYGNVRFTETWLFREDNRFQIRTLAQDQKLD